MAVSVTVSKMPIRFCILNSTPGVKILKIGGRAEDFQQGGRPLCEVMDLLTIFFSVLFGACFGANMAATIPATISSQVGMSVCSGEVF